jgi:MFS-type transporter involved in bile tolerance (Atg22 family)
MILGMLVLLFFVKEQDTSIKLKGEANQYADEKARKKAQKEAIKAQKAALKATKLTKGERKSLIFMLGCLFFLFCAANAITTFFSLFAQEILHMITSEATAIMLLFAVAAAIGALPAGKAGKKFGRKKTILAGLAVFLVAFILFFGVFVGMLGSKNVTINDYVHVNDAYIAIDDPIPHKVDLWADCRCGYSPCLYFSEDGKTLYYMNNPFPEDNENCQYIELVKISISSIYD